MGQLSEEELAIDSVLSHAVSLHTRPFVKKWKKMRGKVRGGVEEEVKDVHRRHFKTELDLVAVRFYGFYYEITMKFTRFSVRNARELILRWQLGASG